MSRILVTGATGNLGGATIDRLLKAADPSSVVGLARDEAKAARLRAKGVEARLGDYENPDALDAAMAGIDKVLLVSGRDQMQLLRQHENVIRAAQRAEVSHLVYTGTAVQDWEASPLRPMLEGHFRTEDVLRESGVPFTVLRNSMYLDALPYFIGTNAFNDGIRIPAGTGRTPFALRREMGEAAGNVLTQDGHVGKTYQLSAAKSYTFAEIAQALADTFDKPVAYEDIEPERFTERLQQAGIPQGAAAGLTGFITDMRDGRYDIVTDDLTDLLGREPVGLKDAIGEVFPPELP